jgi:hypothetical protein
VWDGKDSRISQQQRPHVNAVPEPGAIFYLLSDAFQEDIQGLIGSAFHSGFCRDAGGNLVGGRISNSEIQATYEIRLSAASLLVYEREARTMGLAPS